MAEQVSRLSFKKAIVPTVQKGISTKELLNRLQTLSDELSAVNQDNVDIESYKKVSADLVNKKLLKNSNIGIQAYVCCCISDILRIFAPDAPYTAGQLTSIFEVFFLQLKLLGEKENPYFLQQNYLLKRLAEVKSIILITDLPESEALIRLLFHMFYELSSKDFPSRLEPLVSDILAEVIGESESIPMDVLKLILSTFLTNSGNSYSITASSNSNISSPGFNFSLHICEANVHKMSRQVTQYFSEMLNETINPDSNQADASVINEKAFKTLEKIHSLSIQIWRSVPELLGSVMGLINDELNTDNEKIRVLATTTIGRMIGSSSDVDNTAGFTIAHKSTWINWLSKTMDISPLVRAKWVEQLPDIINGAKSSSSAITLELRNGLTKCLVDANDKVRFIACRSVERLDFEVFTSVICSKVIMNTFFNLIREKNADIRKRAIRILSDIYDRYYNSVSNNVVINFGDHKEEEISELESMISEGIPNHILALNYINDKDITVFVDIILFEKLLPFEVNTIKRVDRLAHFYSSLSDKSKASFTAICKRQQKQADALQHLISLGEEYAKLTSTNDSITNKENIKQTRKSSDDDDDALSVEARKTTIINKLEKIMKWISVSYPVGLNTHSCLDRFVNLKNYRFFNLVKFCISPESDYKTIKNSIKELLTKLNDPKNIKSEDIRISVTTADMVSNFKILLYRASTIIYNKANVAELINYFKDYKHQWSSVSNELLENISSIVPDVFKFHIKSLTDLIITGEQQNDSGFNPRANNLRTIYHFIKKFPDCFPKETDFVETLKSIATTGTPREAKYSIKILGLSQRKEFYASEIANSIFPLDLDNKNLCTHLSSIAEIYLVDPFAVETFTDDINTLLIGSILRSNRLDKDQEADFADDVWIDDINLDQDYQKYSVVNEKLLTIRIFVNRIRALASSSEHSQSYTSEGSLRDVIAKPLKLLTVIIASSGELIKQTPDTKKTPESIKQKLRLYAGYYILKLAKYPNLQLYITQDVINRLSGLLHDENENIRVEFSKKLETNLWNGQLSENFLHLIFLMALEPKSSLKNQVTTWILSSHKRCIEQKDIKFERVLTRLIHCIAHNDTFKKFMSDETESSNKRQVKAYTYALELIMFYLNTIAKQDNISLLYYFASRVKQYRDATINQSLYKEDTFSEAVLNTYRIAELCQLSIQVLNESKRWSMQTWPGKIKLYADLYSPMESYEEAQKIISTVYLDDGTQAELRFIIKKKLNQSSKRKLTSSNEPSKVKKAKLDKPVSKTTTFKTKPREPKPKKLKKDKVEVAPSRKSTRSTNKVSYTEEPGSDSDEGASEDDYLE